MTTDGMLGCNRESSVLVQRDCVNGQSLLLCVYYSYNTASCDFSLYDSSGSRLRSSRAGTNDGVGDLAGKRPIERERDVVELSAGACCDGGRCTD